MSDVEIGMAELLVEGMHCASCVANVSRAAKRIDGLREITIDLANGRAQVDLDDARRIDAVADAISDAGFPARPADDAATLVSQASDRHAQQERARLAAERWKWRAIIGLVLWVPAESLHWGTVLLTGGHDHAGTTWMTWVGVVAGTAVMLIAGRAFFASAWRAAKRRTTNMDTLIALGGGTAYGYSAVALVGHLLLGWPLAELYFAESAALFTLISLGHWLEARARDKTGDAIRALLDLAPQTALRLPPDTEAEASGPDRPARKRLSLTIRAPEAEEVPADTLRPGDRVLVKPAMTVPADGTVESGRGGVDESMLTGEPMPVAKAAGDTVVGGSVNREGSLVVRITAAGSETTLASIVKLVETAQASRPPVQKLADQISAIFVPVVLVIAALTATAWLVLGFASDKATPGVWGDAARATCSVLIIACPCALGLAVPAAIMVGTGRGARRGILLRDIDAIQNAAAVDTVVFDKTGTLTTGSPTVARVVATSDVDERELLRLAASAEQSSEHPLAAAVVANARDQQIELSEATDFTNHPGLGVEAIVEHRRITVGHASLIDAATPVADASGTIAHIALDGQPVGYVELRDAPRNDAADVVRHLRDRGLNVQLLTGDRHEAAEAIARQLGIETIHADVRPDGKQAVIEKLKADGRRVAMVGDGVNDAPALAAAHVGIALAAGTDAAKQAGHVVLMSDRLTDVPAALLLSRRTMRVIKQNLFLAFIYNVTAIPIAAAGFLEPEIAAGAMALSDISVLGNALRLRRAKIG
ncbi:MAG: heavy metal translocating P-type ATPase [Planctomycetota bacterium]